MRKMDDHHFITIKTSDLMARSEIEIRISEQEFSSLRALTDGRCVYKTRYFRQLGGMPMQLDVYGGALAGLKIVKVEFTSVAAAAAFA